MQRSTLLLLTLILPIGLWAQGIKGTIKDNEGNPMPFASIYVKEIGTGTSSNLEGNYELPLKPGNYQITFQFMGYATQIKEVRITNGYVTQNIVMQPQVIQLESVEVVGKAEDPSYTIMRKAIAKAKYHLLQNDSYSAEVYMKGTGQITKVPWILRRTFEKEGIDTSQVFTSESVSEIYFERPNTFKEKVISVRSSGQDMDNANPNAYINGSFYLPKVVNAISPLNPRAFSYYRFEYQGSFIERGNEINKIKVIPRSRGDDVFEGLIYIREDYWNIHSLDLTTSFLGFKININSIYAPIEGEVWMPVTQKFEFSGSVFGLAGLYTYLASLSNYKVVPNTDLDASVVLVDEKIAPAPEEIKAIKSGDLNEGVKQVFEEDKEVSRKQFKKLMREYEKQELEEEQERDVISNYSYKVDTTAAKKDSLYWAGIRPVPLTQKEIQSYVREDSTYFAEKEQAEADSSRLRNGQRFKPTDLLTGGYYKLGERLRYSFDGLLRGVNFNTVEGWRLEARGTFRWRNDTTLRLRLTPTIRYGFASETLYAKLESVFGIGQREQRNTFRISGGNYVEQFNPGVVNPLINSYVTLVGRRNFLKLYEKTYFQAIWARRFRYKHTVLLGFEWSDRTELFNNTDYSFSDRDKRIFRPNRPFNVELGNGELIPNQIALKGVAYYAVRPWQKFRRYNDRLIPIDNSSPEFSITYRKGFDGLLNSDVDFDHVELGLNTQVRLGVRAIFDIDLKAGSFLTDDKISFPDYKHFDGNRLLFVPLKVTGGYRILDYYRYSTTDEYITAFSHLRLRKLLLTQLPMVRLTGVKENVFFNYLRTPASNDYTEIGYTIDNIFRIFRVEFIQSFQDWKAKDFGVRIGVAALIGDSN